MVEHFAAAAALLSYEHNEKQPGQVMRGGNIDDRARGTGTV